MKQYLSPLFCLLILLGALSSTSAQQLRIGMTKKEIIESFPRGALTNDEKIDTSYENEGTDYYGNRLICWVAGHKGEATLYFDTAYHLLRYEWKSLKAIKGVRSVVEKIHDSLSKVYDSIKIENSCKDLPLGLVRRFNYLDDHDQNACLEEFDSSFAYSTGIDRTFRFYIKPIEIEVEADAHWDGFCIFGTAGDPKTAIQLGMSKKDVHYSFTRLTHDSSATDEQLVYALLGYKGNTSIYYDTTNKVIGYKWQSLHQPSEIKAIIRNLVDVLSQRYDSSSVEIPTNSHLAGFVRRINYYTMDNESSPSQRTSSLSSTRKATLVTDSEQ